MKKIIIILLLISLLIMIILFTLNFFINNKVKKIGKILETDLSACYLEYELDTHGGFLGDGDYFARMNCAKKEEIKIDNWHELPISNDIQDVLLMKQCDNYHCLDVYQRYQIPNIENGYYYFIDRNRDIGNKINERASYNFSIGIYDSDNKTLYYYELDT